MLTVLSKILGIFILAQTWFGIRNSKYFIGLRWYLALSVVGLAVTLSPLWIK